MVGFVSRRNIKSLPIATVNIGHTMKINKNVSWLVRTNQMWKIRFIQVFVTIDLLLFAMMIWNINDPHNLLFLKIGVDQTIIHSCFLILGLITVFVLFFLIKCPVCKKKPVYHLVRTTEFNIWFSVLVHSKHCPICRDTGSMNNDEKRSENEGPPSCL